MSEIDVVDLAKMAVSNGRLCPQKMAWEQRYGDDSGVEYAVRYDAVDTHYDGCAKIQIAAVHSADFPITKLDWLIACLCKIRDEVALTKGE